MNDPKLRDFLLARSRPELLQIAMRLEVNLQYLPGGEAAPVELAIGIWQQIQIADRKRELTGLIQNWDTEGLRRYREAALATHDIIDLARPGKNREAGKAELRQVYVPLSVYTETEAGASVPDTNLVLGSIEWSRSRRYPRPIHYAGLPGTRLKGTQLMNEASRLVILGDPGSGKSTLLRWMATAYLMRLAKDPDWQRLPAVKTLPDRDWIPILIRCRDLDERGGKCGLEEMLLQSLQKLQVSRDEAEPLVRLLRSKMEAGKALLLIDGIDEIADTNVRREFCDRVGQLSELPLAKKTPIVLTSRIVGYREIYREIYERLGHGFEHLTIADLTPKDKDEFARFWCGLSEPRERSDQAANDLVRYMHANDHIERLTGNPTLLTMVALLNGQPGGLPQRKADFYWRAFEALLNWSRLEREQIPSEEAAPQLEFVSWQMCFEGREQIRHDEIIRLLESLRKQFPDLAEVKARRPREFLSLFEKRTAILRETGRITHLGKQVPVFEFRHLTFQEFLAGHALVDGTYAECRPNSSVAERVKDLLEHPKVRDNEPARRGINYWREALRTCVTVSPGDECDAALLAVLGTQSGDGWRPQLAAACLADEPDVREDTAKRVLEALCGVIGRADGGTEDGQAADATPETETERRVTELARGRYADLLLETLAREFCKRQPEEREPVARLRALARRSMWVRGAAQPFVGRRARNLELALDLGALPYARVKNADAIPTLLEMLRGDETVVQAAMWGLAEHKKAGWEPVFDEAAKVMTGLAETENGESLNYGGYILEDLPRVQVDERLVEKLSRPPASMQATTAYLLGSIGALAAKAVEPLHKLLESDDADLIASAIWALGRIGDGGMVKVILGNGNDHVDPVVLRAGILTLLRLAEANYHDAEGALLQLVQSEVVAVRAAALMALTRRIDWYDQILLSSKLNGIVPFLDSYAKIEEDRVVEAAVEIGIDPEEVRLRYEKLAGRFELFLSWRPEDPAKDVTLHRTAVFSTHDLGAKKI